MVRRHNLIGLGVAFLAAGVVLGIIHREFIHHLFTNRADIKNRVEEEVHDPGKIEGGIESHWPSRPAAPQLAGVPNFGVVTETLYRGGQPTPGGYQSLKQFGVAMVIDFRYEQDEIEAGRQATEALGMSYVNIPWAAEDWPNNKQVAQFLGLLQTHPGTKVYAHCMSGDDRTGVMIAAYRMALQHWSPEQSLAEMHTYGFHDGWYHFWDYHLQEYVQSFPRQLTTDPDLRAVELRGKPAGAPPDPRRETN